MLSLIPISDANPTKRFPIVTVGLILANIGVFLYEVFGIAKGGDAVLGTSPKLNNYFFLNAPIPCQIGDQCAAFGVPDLPHRGFAALMVAIILSTFLHAGLLHIGGNMLFLWVFGNNVEDYLGRIRYLIFYIVGGIFASYAHLLFELLTAPSVCSPDNVGPCVPSVGASGAVAAVMGAYLLLYPRARVNVLVPIFIIWTVVQMSALAVLGVWFLYQFLIAASERAGPSGVAWMAHVGGFVFGVVAVFLLGGRPQGAAPAWPAMHQRY